jgi:phosphoribosylglycinamide formyltransferase-1
MRDTGARNPTSHDIGHGGFVTREVRVGVLASGRGSNFAALVQATRSQALGAHVVCLGTDNATAGACALATQFDIPSRFVAESARRGRLHTENEQALCDFMQEHAVDLICLAGFMRIVRGPLLQRYPRAILNIHPSLLPSFPGLHAPRQALEHGVRITGCTVHFVDAGIDTGPILLQAAVPVLDGDSVDTLTARIQEQEHRLYPQAVALWAAGRIRFEGGRASLVQTATSQTAAKEESL